MTLSEFVEEYDNLTDDALKDKLKKIFDVISDQEPDFIRDLIMDGFLDLLVTYEAEDSFGTEGMRL